MTQRILRIHLASWRYFALLTLPPLVLILLPPYQLTNMLMMVLFMITHYYCWRLWLDERLFTVLKNEDDLASFDEGMQQLWSSKPGSPRPLNARWRGARKLFFRAIAALLLLWLVVLYRLFWLAGQ